MVDPALEELIQRVNLFLQRWDRLYALVKKIQKAKQAETAEARELGEIRVFVARSYQPLAAEIGKTVDKDDHVLDILSDIRDAESIAELSDMQWRKFDYTWNEAVVTLNQHLGLLEARQRELARISPWDLRLARLKSNPWLIYGLPAAAVLLILILAGVPGKLLQALQDLAGVR